MKVSLSSGDTCMGGSYLFRGRMETNNKQSVGPVRNQRGVQHTAIKSTCQLVTKKREVETSDKFETPEQVSPETIFQNGYSNISLKHGETRRLGNQSRFEGCLHAHPNFQKPSKISKILCKRVSIFSSKPFRSTSITSPPRIFTKVVAVVAAHLRSLRIRFIVHLDDWFLLNQCKIQMISD